MVTYHDFVIKDGELIGKFEEMYQDCEDPWFQSEAKNFIYSKSRLCTAININKYRIKSLVEFGCGLGHTTNLIKSRTGIDVIGVDISETAILKAKHTFPEIKFEVNKIENIKDYQNYDAVLFAEVTFYVLHNLKNIFASMLKHLRGKYFLQNLVFYKGDSQQFGREAFTTFDEFIEYCPLRLLEYSEHYNADVDNNSIEASSIFLIDYK